MTKKLNRYGFENHAGDLRSEELLGLIEQVGTDVCGVMLDPGNALWAMEDPMDQHIIEAMQKAAPKQFSAHATPKSTLKLIIEGDTFHWEPL